MARKNNVALKEKDIVRQLTKNWDIYFPDTKFHRTEYKINNSSVAILSSFKADLKDLGVREESYLTDIAIFCEVKFNSNMRDLMFEIHKQIKIRDWYINIGKSFIMLMVVSDDFDLDMAEFLHENNVAMFIYTIPDDDISKLTIKEFDYNQLTVDADI